MMEEMRSDRDRYESNRTPRFRADKTGDKVTEGVIEREGFSMLESCLGIEREGFSMLESCLGRSISKSSVLEGLSMRRFADIHEET
jgi:hypothetical protein